MMIEERPLVEQFLSPSLPSTLAGQHDQIKRAAEAPSGLTNTYSRHGKSKPEIGGRRFCAACCGADLVLALPGVIVGAGREQNLYQSWLVLKLPKKVRTS